MPLLMVPPLVFVAAFMVAYGSSLTVRRWSSGMAKWLGRASWLVSQVVPGLGGYELKLVKYISHELGQWASGAIFAMARWLTGLRQYILIVGFWTLLWPVELYKFASWLVHRYIPKAITERTRPIDRRARSAEAAARDAERRAVRGAKAVPGQARTVVVETVPREVRDAADKIEWLRRHWKAVTAAAAGVAGVALPFPRIGVKPREWTGVLKRLGKLERATAGLGAVALVTAALARMGLGILGCRNVKKNLVHLCRFSPLRFADLLLDATAILSLISVVEFARELQGLEDEAVKILSLGIREFPAV